MSSKEEQGDNLEKRKELESLGVVAGSIAHDLNNLLTGVLGHVSFLRLCLPQSGQHKESLDAIEDGARRAAAMTQQILEFASGREAEFTSVNLSLLTKAAVNLIRASLPKNVKLNFDEQSADVSVNGAESQLSQVVLNLAVNAKDALPKGGVIDVCLEVSDLQDADVCAQLGLEQGAYAKLSVQDNGTGIPAEIREQIFEPFFTTKAASGTGLGLATVLSIVNSHRGVIVLDTAENVGTQFSVYLPAGKVRTASVEKSAAKSSGEAEAVPGGTERILVIDDEEAVRMIISRSLQHLGYHVEVAENGKVALEHLKTNSESYDLVILDMIMPEMPGDQVFFELQSVAPKLGVLIASGYSSDHRTRAVLDSGGRGFIQKPFSVEELARCVRECLDEQS